ncbi:prolyl oligopeptidase family serine peptidase [Flagellimonas sp. CMM7]|uniref:carboxylesterase family protein n=1 Tax=Flagellimonas sp. CMM7 TaxID=2654676 RepID=UPI0013D0490B|nr:prolyl oligopeptidase family serine peptidase [Flagellimonas sp. CMM7]UII80086.1 prolyl oligopeptidase family serine peptidase [Flagellimonas sp. CMM7]
MTKHNLGFLALCILLTMNYVNSQQVAKQLVIKTDYLIYTPPGYDEESEKKWPLMINLHGTDRNVTIETLPYAFLPHLISSGKDFPMLIVNPMCNKGRWNVEILNNLLDDIVKEYAVDEDRIYLTGYSMGGYGTWEWVFQNPEKFAAISPIAGCADQSDLKRIWRVRNIPTWIIHGEKDAVVDKACNYETMKQLKVYGSDAEFTIYPGIGHKLVDVWGKTLKNDAWYTWMLDQSRDKNVPEPLRLKKETYESYVGEYILQDRKEDTLRILYDRDQLYIKYEGEGPLPIHAESKSLFYLEEDPIIGVEFIIEDDEVLSFNVLEERAWPAKKIK